jgi:sulfoquinovosidase
MRPLPHWILSGAVVGMRGGARGPSRARSPAHARRRLLAAGLGKAEAEEFRYAAVVELGTGQRTRYLGWDRPVAGLRRDDVRVVMHVSPFLADPSEKANHRRNLLAEARDRGYLVEGRDAERI